MTSLLMREESPADEGEIAAVVTAAFGQPDEATLVGALRRGGHVVLSLVAEDPQGAIVGHVLFSRLRIEAEKGSMAPRATGLAPVAVAPDRQRRGIGSALIRQGLQRLAAMDDEICFVLGEPAYYRRFGFRASLAAQFDCAYAGPFLMATALGPATGGHCRGRLVYPEPFDQLA